MWNPGYPLTSISRQTHAVRQGFQDLGAADLDAATEMRNNGTMRMEGRTGAAQKEGGVHDMHSYTKQLW